MAALCLLIYKESDRVKEQICGEFGPVHMEDCDEGYTSSGYRILCWITISILSLAVVAVAYTFLKQRLALIVSVKMSRLSHSIYLYLTALAMVSLGVAMYAFFITMVVYQVSCGENTEHELDLMVYQWPVTTWDYDQAPRVLVFFTLIMTFWHFSFAAFTLEFLTASISSQSFFNLNGSPKGRMKTACAHYLKNLGSVLFAAAVIPPCRALAHALSGLHVMLKPLRMEKLVECMMVVCRYGQILKYMNSNGLALIAISGLPYQVACREAMRLIDNHKEDKITSVQSVGLVIWLNQLVITLIGPVFVMYWILYEDDVFQAVSTKDVSSVIAMGLFSLVFTWFLAQVYAAYARGTIHSTVLAYILDLKAVNRICESELRDFLDGPKTMVKPPNRAPAAEKDFAMPVKEALGMETPQPPKKPSPRAPDSSLVLSAPPPTRNGNRSASEIDGSMNIGEGDVLIPIGPAKPMQT